MSVYKEWRQKREADLFDEIPVGDNPVFAEIVNSLKINIETLEDDIDFRISGQGDMSDVLSKFSMVANFSKTQYDNAPAALLRGLYTFNIAEAVMVTTHTGSPSECDGCIDSLIDMLENKLFDSVKKYFIEKNIKLVLVTYFGSNTNDINVLKRHFKYLGQSDVRAERRVHIYSVE